VEPALVALAVAEDRLIAVGLLICGDHPLVVAEDHLVGGDGYKVVRGERYLAAAAGSIDDIGRDRETAGMTPQALHDLNSLPHRSAEMAETFGEIALIASPVA
jgi:hypothetical protein